MRGSHSKYIGQVNVVNPCWYIPVGRKRWRSVIDLWYVLPDGTHAMVPSGTETDLFSCVPDTGYWELHKSAHLHDWMRKQPQYSRAFSDDAFAADMHLRITHIRRMLQRTDCPEDVTDREMVRLRRMASMYVIGVSGWIGSVYIALDRWF